MAKDYKLRKFGPLTERRDYSKTVHNLPVTDLVAVQKESFNWFLKNGLLETFSNIYPIRSTNGRITIEFLPKTLTIVKPEDEFSAIKMAKAKGTTYSAKIYATLRKIDEETGEVKNQEVLFGEIPMMTSGASFIINGSEKVIVSQLIRAAGPYYGLNVRPGGKLATDKDLFNYLEIIPRLGVWMDILHKTTVENPDVKISINKRKLISLSVFLRSFGLTKNDIFDLFGNFPLVKETTQKDRQPTENDCLEFVHGILRKGDRITEDSKRNLYANILFNKRRYNLSRTGRYMLNKKLVLTERITDTILAQNLVSPETGEILFPKGLEINFEVAKQIQDSFATGLLPIDEIPSINPSQIYGAQTEEFPNLKTRNKIISVYIYPNERWEKEGKEPVRVIANDPSATEEHLLISDIIAALSYYFNFEANLGSADDKDSLENKRVVPIGELLQNQFQIALTKLERTAKERMSAKEADKITPKNVTNNKSVYDQFKTFFNLSQLSQFMDQMNPLAEVSNKRRVTSLGPGGLNRETAKFDVRDVHTTHYGRICPIETPEGQNIGLILNFANYARINELGFIETPYYKVINQVVDASKPIYLSAADELGHIFGQSAITLDENNKIIDQEVIARKNGEYSRVKADEIEYIDVSSKQMTSVGSSAIPFLENNDANRALMGANMQRQAVPLIRSEAPFVGTGIEADIANYAATNLKADAPGTVTYVDSRIIQVKEKNREHIYKLRTFERSNQGSVITQKPLVKVGDQIKEGSLLTDGPSFDQGELAIGKNVMVAFTTWNGYNYEDAVIISEKLVKNDTYTSIHIEEKTIEFRKQKLGDDILTNEIPNVSKFSIRNLDENGIIRIGSEVQTGDVLVGRVSPKGEDNPTPEEKLIAAIFFQKFKNSKDTSLKVAHGHGGTVIDVEILSRENGDKLQDDVSKIVKVYIAQKRKIKVGDKMAGRHGNKGVISRVLPVEDMPHLEDGTPIDIMLNPQGVPSRMNIGQVLELHLGIAAKKLNIKFASPVFDGVNFENINEALKEANLPENGKFNLYDPISGEKFAAKISAGIMYMLKLAHMVDDKMHARSVGPYSLITQQPLGGKSQNGGQRFGEMETWAIEAYGTTEVLQELLTYKSDNIDGRNKVYNALANGNELPTPGTPESFNVLAYELRGLGMKLEVELSNQEGEEE